MSAHDGVVLPLRVVKAGYYLLGVVNDEVLGVRSVVIGSGPGPPPEIGEGDGRVGGRLAGFGAGAGVWWSGGSGLGGGHRDLGAAGTGMTSHQAVGEEAPAVGMVLAGTGPPGLLLGAVCDRAVTVHDQLSGTAPHLLVTSPSGRPSAGGETL